MKEEEEEDIEKMRELKDSERVVRARLRVVWRWRVSSMSSRHPKKNFQKNDRIERDNQIGPCVR